MNAIEPDHYRKGQTDLFESWYQTYPFNEFCSMMESHADKYIKRHRYKGDPLENLEKAIYTLTRLKKYHELEQKSQ